MSAARDGGGSWLERLYDRPDDREFTLESSDSLIATFEAAPGASACEISDCGAGRRLLRVDVTGGPGQVVCPAHLTSPFDLEDPDPWAILQDTRDVEFEDVRWISEELEALVDVAYHRQIHPIEILRLLRVEYRSIVREEHGDVDGIDELLDACIEPCSESVRSFVEGVEGEYRPRPRDGSEPCLQDIGLERGGFDE